MKNIYVRKIYPYDPSLGSIYSKYVGYSKVTSQLEDPGISSTIDEPLPDKIKMLFCSNTRRGIETAEHLNHKLKCKLVITKNLNEVLFDLQELLSEKEFREFGSELVRSRFIGSFVTNRLLESRSDIYRRISAILEMSMKTEGDVVLVSHSFFMKIMRTYIYDTRLSQNPNIIREYFDPSKKTFEFGKGFDLSM